MKFTIIWTKEADAILADIWVRSAQRIAITNAADRIDALLLEKANEHVDDESISRHFLCITPLAIVFEVSTQDRMIKVIYAWEVA